MVPSNNMKMYSWSRDVAMMKPKQEIARTTRVITNGHFLPTISDKKPTGTMVDEMITPMKKQAPKNPILALDSQSIGESVWFCQLSMY